MGVCQLLCIVACAAAAQLLLVLPPEIAGIKHHNQTRHHCHVAATYQHTDCHACQGLQSIMHLSPAHLEVVGGVALLVKDWLHIVSARVNGCLKHGVLVSTMHQHLTLWRQQQQQM
jgi:hypothetical protein